MQAWLSVVEPRRDVDRGGGRGRVYACVRACVRVCVCACVHLQVKKLFRDMSHVRRYVVLVGLDEQNVVESSCEELRDKATPIRHHP